MGPTRRPLKVESKLKGTELIWEMSTCTLTNLTDILIYLRFCSLSAETARLLGRGVATKIDPCSGDNQFLGHFLWMIVLGITILIQ